MPSGSSPTCSPGSWGFSPFLVAPQGEEAQALSGAPQAGGRPRVGRRSGNPPGRLHAAGRAASPPGRQSAGLPGAGWVRWGSFSVYGVKLHLLCATNGVPISYELTPANVAEVVRLTEELINEANLTDDLARRLLGDLAYRSEAKRSEALVRALAECGISLVTERADQRGQRQRIEIALSSLKRVFGLGETLATTLVALASRIAAKICAYTYGFHVSRKSPPGPTARAHQGTMSVNLTTHI